MRFIYRVLYILDKISLCALVFNYMNVITGQSLNYLQLIFSTIIQYYIQSVL